MFDLTLEEIEDMSLNEGCEYLIKVDDNNDVYCLLSDGFQSFDLIFSGQEEEYSVRIGEGVMSVPSGTYQEVFTAIEKVKNGEMETIH